MRKIRTAGAFMLIAAALSGCGSVRNLTPASVNRAPVIDTSLLDWKTETFNSFDDGKIKVGFYPDASYYYFAASISDKELARKIAAKGVKIWIDPLGEEKQNLQMNLPMADMGPGIKPGEMKPGEVPQGMQPGNIPPDGMQFGKENSGRTDSDQSENKKGGLAGGRNPGQRNGFHGGMDSVRQGVVVFDSKVNHSEVFVPGIKPAAFEGKVTYRFGVAYLEVKIPVDINEHFEGYHNLKTGKAVIGIAANDAETAGPGRGNKGGMPGDRKPGGSMNMPGGPGGEMDKGGMPGGGMSPGGKGMPEKPSDENKSEDVMWFTLDKK